MSSPMACNAGGLLGLRDCSRIFREPFTDFQVIILRLSRCLRKTGRPFTFEHAWKHAFGLRTSRREMLLKVSKGNKVYDTSFAKSKVPFASTIATFRGRTFKPDAVVLYKTSTWVFQAMPTCISAIVSTPCIPLNNPYNTSHI